MGTVNLPIKENVNLEPSAPEADTAGEYQVMPFSYLRDSMTFLPGSNLVQIPYDAIVRFVKHNLWNVPFDPHLYRVVNSGFDEIFKPDEFRRIAEHYQGAGYFEGRTPHLYYFPELEQSPISNPVPRAYFAFMRKYQDAAFCNDIPSAMDALASAMLAYPRGFNAHYYLGHLLFRRFDFIGALDHLLYALRERPDHEYGARSLATLMSTIRDGHFVLKTADALFPPTAPRPFWLDVEFCKTYQAMRQYGLTRSILARLDTTNAAETHRNALARVRRGLSEDLAGFYKLSSRLKSDSAHAADLLEGLRLLARFGRLSYVKSNYEKILALYSVIAEVSATELSALVELHEVLHGPESALSYIDSALVVHGATMTARISARIPVLSHLGRYDDVVQSARDNAQEPFDDETSDLIATAMLIRKLHSELWDFSKAWNRRATDKFLPFGYALLAAIQTNLLQPIYLTRFIVEMEMTFRSRTGSAPLSRPTARIPKFIVQYWHAIDPPEEVKLLTGEWSAQFGPAHHQLFNDATARTFIIAEYGDGMLRLYDFCYHPAMKADLFRLLFLYKRGGYYFDADDACMPGFQWLVRNASDAELILVTGQQGHDGGPQHLTLNNLFIASVPNHPVIRNALDNAVTTLRAAMVDNTVPSIWSATGPGALTVGLQRILFSDNPADLDVLKTIYLYDGTTHLELVGQARPLRYKAAAGGNWGAAEQKARAAKSAMAAGTGQSPAPGPVAAPPPDTARLMEAAANAVAAGNLALARTLWEQARPAPDAPIHAWLRPAEHSGSEDPVPLLLEALERFPGHPWVLHDLARTFERKREWDAADTWWRRYIARNPGQPLGFAALASVLRAANRVETAVGVLRTGLLFFPDAAGLRTDLALAMEHQGDRTEALRQLDDLIKRSPSLWTGYREKAKMLGRHGREAEADLLVETMAPTLPGNADALHDFARLAERRQKWADAEATWRAYLALDQQAAWPFIALANALHHQLRHAQTEAVLDDARQRFPANADIPVEAAKHADRRGDLDRAAHHWREVAALRPQSPIGALAEAEIRRRQGLTEESDRIIAAALARLPDEPSLFEAYGLAAMARGDWSEALDRLVAGQRRFPSYDPLRQRIYEVRLKIADEGGAAPSAELEEDVSDDDRDLVMQFESLGGGGHGCEFGIFQRHFGAEPLGLLRWADIFQDKLCELLETEFAGVGDPEFTRVFVPENMHEPEYWTTDRRYHMAMRTFVRTKDVTMEQMVDQVYRRYKFLSRKLSEDLRSASKIFVYKNIRANLTDAELLRLHRACRRYGNNTLFYICYEDDDHPCGTVRMAADGLMIGYIDHFSNHRDTDAYIGPVNETLLELCKAAMMLWRSVSANTLESAVGG